MQCDKSKLSVSLLVHLSLLTILRLVDYRFVMINTGFCSSWYHHQLGLWDSFLTKLYYFSYTTYPSPQNVSKTLRSCLPLRDGWMNVCIFVSLLPSYAYLSYNTFYFFGSNLSIIQWLMWLSWIITGMWQLLDASDQHHWSISTSIQTLLSLCPFLQTGLDLSSLRANFVIFWFSSSGIGADVSLITVHSSFWLNTVNCPTTHINSY